jgi:hypothetical protein
MLSGSRDLKDTSRSKFLLTPRHHVHSAAACCPPQMMCPRTLVPVYLQSPSHLGYSSLLITSLTKSYHGKSQPHLLLPSSFSSYRESTRSFEVREDCKRKSRSPLEARPPVHMYTAPPTGIDLLPLTSNNHFDSARLLANSTHTSKVSFIDVCTFTDCTCEGLSTHYNNSSSTSKCPTLMTTPSAPTAILFVSRPPF